MAVLALVVITDGSEAAASVSDLASVDSGTWERRADGRGSFSRPEGEDGGEVAGLLGARGEASCSLILVHFRLGVFRVSLGELKTC